MIKIAKQVNYKVLDYIESTGTQYIDTGIKANNNVGIELDIQMQDVTTTAFLCGSRVGYLNNGIAFTQEPTWQFGAENVGNSSIGSLTTRSITSVKNSKAYFNDTLISSFSSTFSNTLNMYIFGLNNNGALHSLTAKMKLYSCKIYNGSTLVRDFIPVKDDNNVACLFDKVSKTCFYNQGTGVFTTGSETGETITQAKIAIRKMYVSDSTSKQVRSVYIKKNDNVYLIAKAKPQYIKNITTGVCKNASACGATSDYFITGGGLNSSGSLNTTAVDCIDKNFTLTSASAIVGRRVVSSCNFNNRVAFIGGMKSTSTSTSYVSNNAETIDNNLVKSTLTNIVSAGWKMPVSANNTHMIVCGGTNYSASIKTACSYDTNFTKTNITSLDLVRANGACASNNEIIVYVAGYQSTSTSKIVECYNNSNVHFRLSDLPLALTYSGACSSKDYAITWGGENTNDYKYGVKNMFAFDKNQVRTETTLPEIGAYGWGCYSNGYYCLSYGRQDSTSGTTYPRNNDDIR